MQKYLPYAGFNLVRYDLMPIFLERQFAPRGQVHKTALDDHLRAMVSASLTTGGSSLVHCTISQFEQLLQSGEGEDDVGGGMIDRLKLDPLIESEQDLERLYQAVKKYEGRSSRSTAAVTAMQQASLLDGQPAHVGVPGSELSAKMMFKKSSWAEVKREKDVVLTDLAREKVKLTAVVRGALSCPFDGPTLKPERTADETVRLVSLGCDEVMLEDGTGTLQGRQLENALKTIAACSVPPSNLSIILRGNEVAAAANAFRIALSLGVTKFGICSGSFSTSMILDEVADEASPDQVDFGDGILCGTEMLRWALGMRGEQSQGTRTPLKKKSLVPPSSSSSSSSFGSDSAAKKDQQDLKFIDDYQLLAEAVQRFVK